MGSEMCIRDRYEGAHQLLNHRHPRGTTHQHNVIDIVCRPAGVAQRRLDRTQQTIQQIGAESFESGAVQAGFDVQRTIAAPWQ